MQTTAPFISVIVPAYNRANLITNTIHSILAQTYTEFEVIIVDDGSTDNTDAIVRSIKDPRLFYYKKENGERGAARNYGIDRAKGQYITFIDSDDLYYQNAFQNAFDCLNRLDFPNCFAQAFEVIDITTNKRLQAPKLVRSETINRQILKGNFLGCIGVFVKKGVLAKIRFEEDRMFAGTEDWLLWLQLSARFPFYYSNTVCAYMVEHVNRSVLGFTEDKLLYRTNLLKDKLTSDTIFAEKYGKGVIKKIYAHMLSYTSLHLAISNKKNQALQYLYKAVGINVSELFSRRTLGILKTILIR